MVKILCIDDMPDEEIMPTSLSLRDILSGVYSDTPYQLIFKKIGKEGVKAAADDAEVRLVLLDIRFDGKPEGPEIADDLKNAAPDTKIIVLTSVDEKGKKISFGWKPNVVHYMLKKDFSNTQVLQKLLNLSKAVIEDYGNKCWTIEYPAAGTINLTNHSTQKTYGIDIPTSMDSVVKLVIASPNKPVINPGGSTQQQSKTDASLNKVLNTINTKVLEGTDWNTWGILSRENCGKGQLKLVMAHPSTRSVASSPYLLRSDFEGFKMDVLSKLTLIEQTLKKRKK
jgi:CheY-like chemotaxis protein